MRQRFFALFAIFLLAPAFASATEITVTMAGSAYQPGQISASVGDTIRFVNDDKTDHDVFVPTAGHAVDLGKQIPGKETVLNLAKAGMFEVECVFHSNMLVAVEVK